MSLSVELSKTLLKELPGLLVPNPRDTAAACTSLSRVLGCQLAYILATQGEHDYKLALALTMDLIDIKARSVAAAAAEKALDPTTFTVN